MTDISHIPAFIVFVLVPAIFAVTFLILVLIGLLEEYRKERK